MLLLLLGALASAGLAAAGQKVTDEMAGGAEIRGVIERQLAAFERDDAHGAFAFASPGIRRRFGDPETFLDMVRRHYPPVYRPRGVAFGALRDSPRGLLQEVQLTGPDGRAVTAVYIMERQPDGNWKIDGVYLLEAPGRTT
jgi:hypothetical protein